MALARSLAALAALLLISAPQARAASISIDPVLTLLTCSSPGCEALTVQLDLSLGEVDVDSIQFEISVTNPDLIGLADGDVPGNPIDGYTGGVTFDGTLLIGSLDTVPGTFDDGSGLVQTIDLATIPLHYPGGPIGTSELRFVSLEVFCSTCSGSGFYSVTNTNGELLATIVTPEPATLGLLSLGLVAIAAVRRRAQGVAR